jgi:hypothetical protein
MHAKAMAADTDGVIHREAAPCRFRPDTTAPEPPSALFPLHLKQVDKAVAAERRET